MRGFELSVARFLFGAQSQQFDFQLRDFLSHAAGRDLSFSLWSRSGDSRRLGWGRDLLLCVRTGTDCDSWLVGDPWLGLRGGHGRRLWRVFTLENLQEFRLVCFESVTQLVSDRAFRRINHQAIAVAGFQLHPFFAELRKKILGCHSSMTSRSCSTGR